MPEVADVAVSFIEKWVPASREIELEAWTRRGAVHNPPLNHIGLWIDDLHAAVAWLEKAGVRFTPGGIRKGAAGFDVTFIHPKENEQFPIGGEGVLIELVQAPEDVIAALG